MKKFLVSLTASLLATSLAAATFNWSTTDKVYGVAAASVEGNGTYASDGSTTLRDNSTLSYTFYVYAAGTETLLGSSGGSLTATKKDTFSITGIDFDSVGNEVKVDYKVVISGTQNDLAARGKSGDYDYSAATISATFTGTTETIRLGNTAITSSPPTEWTVAGITSSGSAVPEPTSGLLLVLGLAGLALKRRFSVKG